MSQIDRILERLAICELHLHLDGSLSKKAILEVAKHDNFSVKKDFCLNAPKNCTSLNEYLKCFEMPNLALQSEFGLGLCYADLLKRLARNGVKYAEIRMAPQLSTNKGLSQEKVVQTLIQTGKECEKYGICSNLILCMMRGENNLDKNTQTVLVAKKYLGSGVVALDLAGAEGLFANEMFEKELTLANELNVPLLIHAGEVSDAKSVLSALKFNPKRIGHGIKSADDESALNALKSRNICLEICPKSNLDTKVVLALSDLPIKKFLENDIKITLNSDNMSVSSTTLKDEFKRIFSLGFDIKILKEFATNAVIYSFASDEIKERLLKLLKNLEF